MGWYGLEDLEPEDLERVRNVQAYARKVLKMHAQGKYDPEKTAFMSAKLGLTDPAELEGFADDMSAAFTPQQVLVLKKLARRMRKYARKVGHYHTHGPGGQFGTVAMPRRRRHKPVPVRRRRLTDVPVSGWELEDDDELGFLPALAGVVSSVAGPLLGGLFGGGKKSAPKPAPAPQQPIIMGGGGGGGMPASNVNLPAIGGVVADQIRAVPPPVRQQVTDAIREALDRTKAGQQDVAQLMKDITKQLGPSLKAQLDSVNQAALQRQATYEHESLKRTDKRWKSNAEAQRRILARLDEMEGKMGAAIVGTKARSNAVARAFGIPPRYQG